LRKILSRKNLAKEKEYWEDGKRRGVAKRSVNGKRLFIPFRSGGGGLNCSCCFNWLWPGREERRGGQSVKSGDRVLGTNGLLATENQRKNWTTKSKRGREKEGALKKSRTGELGGLSAV